MLKIKTGKLVGTGAAITVSCGFRPQYIRVVNAEDGDTIDEYFASGANTTDIMAAGTSVRTTTAVATLGSNGITLFAGSTSAPQGFTLGTSISEADKDLFFVAIGE